MSINVNIWIVLFIKIKKQPTFLYDMGYCIEG